MNRLPLIVVASLCLLVAGCATFPKVQDNGALQREAVAGSELPPPPPPKHPLRASGGTTPSGAAEVSRGTGVFVRNVGPAHAPEARGKGDVVFNFEDQPVQAVVKAILGDFLHASYAIAPGVKGSVTFSTAQPVKRSEALPILETLLSWSGNALVRKDGRYLVLPSKQAVAGNLVPSLGAPPPAAGFSARLFQLHYVSATEMQKLLKPFATDGAFLLVDPARDVLVMSGTPSQLDNYQRTIKTFDVDWLKGMSVGVYGLQRASVEELIPELDKLFGPKGSTPLAGMVRFIPIKRTNSIVVISPQPDYLNEVQQWIERIDRGGGNQPQLYVYDVKNVQATYLAHYLNEIYNNAPAGGGGEQNAGQVGPGLTSRTLGGGGGSSGYGGKGGGTSVSEGMGGDGGGSGSLGSGGGSTDAVGLPPRRPASGSNDAGGGGSSGGQSGSALAGSGIRITAVDENNQLLVRCRPSQWDQIQSAIQRLDVVPLQVQIETRILEVNLTGEFSFGVQWYLEGLIGSQDGSPGGFAQPNNQQQGALGLGGVKYSPGNDALFYSFIGPNLQAAVHAIETSGNTKVLSAPSLVVMNNQDALIQVGTQVPVNQTFITGGINSTTNNSINTLGSVEYKDTGVILQVRPRVNPGGLVYLSLDQVVSKPGQADKYGNFPIDKRELATQVAVQSGQTVMLGGLIQQNESTTDRGVPWLNRIPLLGRLFGTTDRSRNRTELLLLITPRVITSSADARTVTDDYQKQFESLRPIRLRKAAAAKDGKAHAGAPAEGGKGAGS